MHSSVIISAISISRGSLSGASASSRHVGDFRFHPRLDDRVHERRHVAAELGDLAHDRRRDERVLLGGRQKQRFDLRIQVPVHRRHLKFVFEVRDRAKAAQDDARVLCVHEIHQQRREAFDLDVGERRQHFARHLDPLGGLEERVSRFAAGDADDDGLKQPRGTAHQILVPARERVERAGIDDFERRHG